MSTVIQYYKNHGEFGKPRQSSFSHYVDQMCLFLFSYFEAVEQQTTPESLAKIIFDCSLILLIV